MRREVCIYAYYVWDKGQGKWIPHVGWSPKICLGSEGPGTQILNVNKPGRGLLNPSQNMFGSELQDNFCVEKVGHFYWYESTNRVMCHPFHHFMI